MILTNIVVLITTIGAMMVLTWQLTVLSLALMSLFIWLADRTGRARRAVGSTT